MYFKGLQEKLKVLQEKIQQQGEMSADDEQVLKELIHETLISASDELQDMQDQLSGFMKKKAINDNVLSEDQKTRLTLLEKTGTGSTAIH